MYTHWRVRDRAVLRRGEIPAAPGDNLLRVNCLAHLRKPWHVALAAHAAAASARLPLTVLRSLPAGQQQACHRPKQDTYMKKEQQPPPQQQRLPGMWRNLDNEHANPMCHHTYRRAQLGHNTSTQSPVALHPNAHIHQLQKAIRSCRSVSARSIFVMKCYAAIVARGASHINCWVH